jgi:hypothetical protein
LGRKGCTEYFTDIKDNFDASPEAASVDTD